MFKNLDIFQSSAAMASHAATRQAVTAQNIANADTPGYQARTTQPFSEIASDFDARSRLKHTKLQHIQRPENNATARVSIADTEPSPNGNSVSLEEEMVNAVNIQREHDKALAIYKHALNVLRGSLGR